MVGAAVGLGDLDARVLRHLDGSLRRGVAARHPDGVGAGKHPRTPWRSAEPLAAVRDRGVVAEVPVDPVEPGLELRLQGADRVAAHGADRDLGVARSLRIDVQQRSLRRVLRDEELVAGVPLVGVDAPGDGIPHREEVEVLFEHGSVEGGERCDVVGDPDAAAVGAEDQVVLPRVDRQVVHRHGGDLAPDPVPVGPAVKRHVDPELAARHQEVLVLVVLADHVQRGLRRKRAGEGLEAVPVVVAHERVGGVVVVPVPVQRDVDPGRRMRRRDQAGHVRLIRHPGQVSGQVVPGLAPVAAPLQVAVVGPHVDDPLFERGDGDGHDLAETRDPVVARQRVLGHRDVHDGQLVAIEALRQVVGPGPRVAPVGRDEKPVPAVIHGVRVVRRDHDGTVPVEAVALAAVLRLRPDQLGLGGPAVQPAQVAVLGFHVDGVRVARDRLRVEPVPAPDPEPVLVADPLAEEGARRRAPAPVVLKAAVDHVRGAHVVADLVELPQRDGVHEVPAPAPVPRNVDPPVVPEHHVVRVGGIDPQGVMIHVDPLDPVGCEGPPAVLGVVHLGPQDPDALVVVGVDADLAVVHGPRVGVAHALPGESLVLGTEHSAFPVLDDGVDDAWIAAIDVQADPSGVALGKTAAQFRPGVSAIRGAVDSAARAAAREPVGAAPALVERGVEGVRALGVHRKFHRAGVLVTGQHPVPGLPAVPGPVDAPLLVRAPQVPKRGDVHRAGIRGMHQHPADMVRVLESLVRPGGSPVGGDVHPVAPGTALAIRRLAGAHPHDRRVGRRHRDGPDRGHLLVLELRDPGDPVVRGLPDARGGGTHPEHLGVGFDDRDVVDPASHDRRTDVPPFDPVQDGLDLLGGLRGHRRGSEQQGADQQP